MLRVTFLTEQGTPQNANERSTQVAGDTAVARFVTVAILYMPVWCTYLRFIVTPLYYIHRSTCSKNVLREHIINRLWSGKTT